MVVTSRKLGKSGRSLNVAVRPHVRHVESNRSRVISDDDSYEEDFSIEEDMTDDEDMKDLFTSAERTSISRYLNKALLLFPLVISLIFRSIPSSNFRAIAIAWGVILSLTSEISMDEGVIPALVAASLGGDNALIAQNMYISIARSRLGLLALALLSYYSSNYQILICGVLLKLMVSFSNMLLQGSIPKSEITLICGAIVNVLYALPLSPLGDIYNYQAIVASGIVAAVPCYPLLARFARNYKASHGTAKQPKLVLLIYVTYFAVAIYLYFFLYGIELGNVRMAIADNTDLIAYWASSFTIALTAACLFGNRIGLDGRRKLWHITTVVMFLPKFVRERPFTRFALSVAIVLFIALEVARATALPPFGVPLHHALQNFVDHRDNRGPVIISHIYLLLGVATPILLARSPAGVICLGLGDTFASQIGRRFGHIRVFGHKSVEGCLAFALAAGAALYCSGDQSQIPWIVIPTAFLEAVTPLNDNLIVPMYMLALQGIFNARH